MHRLLARVLAVRQLLASADVSRATGTGTGTGTGTRTLADCERVLGADHRDTLTSRNNLERARTEGHSD